MSEAFQIQVKPDQIVSAVLYRASREARATLILGHGAGADQNSPFMREFAEGLSARGINIVTFNFLYKEQGRSVPDPNKQLETCYEAVIRTVSARSDLSPKSLYIGGKSLGGRIASQAVAANADLPVRGLVFLGYPLHPPGKPHQLRAGHFEPIRIPMLFIQGSRDAFGTPDELRPILQELNRRFKIYVVESGDHSLNVPKKSAPPREQVLEAIKDEIARWINEDLSE